MPHIRANYLHGDAELLVISISKISGSMRDLIAGILALAFIFVFFSSRLCDHSRLPPRLFGHQTFADASCAGRHWRG